MNKVMFRKNSNASIARTNKLESNENIGIEDTDGCEEFIAGFMSGRDIVRLTAPDREQKQKHQVRYEKELKYDEDEKENGRRALKKYREELVNPKSKCDAQYINNLNTYYGDGSRLQHTAKPHYACDFVRTANGVDSLDTEVLKSLKVSRRKVTPEWLLNTNHGGRLASRLRRSFSCIHIDFVEKPEKKMKETRERSKSSRATVKNRDVDFDISKEWYQSGPQVPFYLTYESLCSDIAYAYKTLIRRVVPLQVEKGEVKISKVLFSTEDIYAFVVPGLKDQQEELRKYSKECETLRGRQQKAMAWWKRNTILYLPEFESEGTQFRRARHVRKLPSGNHLFVEMETGMLRELRTISAAGNPEQSINVIPMPKGMAGPPAIMEVVFKEAKTPTEVSDQIREIRRTGIADIAYFERTGPPNLVADQNEIIPETGVILPPKQVSYERQKAPLTRLFCSDKDCMGMCCTDVFYRKPLPSPVTSVAPTPTWNTDSKYVLDVTRERKKEPMATSSPSYLIAVEDDHFFDRTQ